MMVGHDLTSYAPSLPQPPISPPMLSKDTSSSSSSPSSSNRHHHRHIPHRQHFRPSLFHTSSSTLNSSPGLRSDYSMFSTTAVSSPSLSSSSLSSSQSNSAANLSTSNSTLRLPPPRPSSAMSTRLPVRLSLGDPRFQSYMISAKPAATSSSAARATATTPSSSTSPFGRHDQIPAVGVTAPGGSFSSETVRSGISSSSNGHHHQYHAIPPFHPSTSSPSSAATLLARSAPEQGSGSSRNYSEGHEAIRGQGHGQWNNVNNNDNKTSMTRHSTSPGSQPRSLPSPTPSMTPMSPDWQVVGRHSNDPTHLQQPPQHRAHQQHDLLSPSASEMDLGADTKPLTPLFRTNSPPPAFNATGHRSSASTSHLGPAHMTNPHSASSIGSAPSSAVIHPNPALDHRAVTPPSTSLGWSSKHHHHRIPVRSPDRAGHELMTTSTTDSEPSAFMNMNFYDIYRQNPKLLRPEGGRHEERRLQAFHQHHHQQANSHYHPHSHPDSAYPAEYSRPIGHAKRSSAGGYSGLSRRQSMPLISTATQRVLRHEDAKVEQMMSYDEDIDDIAVKQDPDYHYHSGHGHGLGIQPSMSMSMSSSPSSSAGAHKHKTVIPSIQSRPAPMSIHHILSDDTTHGSEQDRFSFRSDDDDDDEEMDRYTETMGLHYGYDAAPYSSSMSSKASQKRKKGDDLEDEPKKRKRISKKQAAEMGLLGPDGVVKRKRTKKIREPGYVSPTGFTHGGERVVQEPEEIVVPDPDIGPVSVLDHQLLPKIIWKGYPLNISGKPGVEYLHHYEAHIASTLRLSPAQYLNCKRTLIVASRQYLAVPNGKQFKKSDAQKLCRIDVNKTSRLWEIFAKVGWLAGITEQDI